MRDRFPHALLLFAVLEGAPAQAQTDLQAPSPNPTTETVAEPPAPATPAEPSPAPLPTAAATPPPRLAPPLPPSTTMEPMARDHSGLFAAGDLTVGRHAFGRNGVTISGAGLGARLSLGYATDHGAAFAGFSYFATSGLRATGDDGFGSSTNDESLSATSWFLGGRFYTESDYFVELSGGTLKDALHDDRSGARSSSDLGIMLSVALGKEWLLRNGLTVAVTGRVGVGALPAGSDREAHLTATHLELGLGLGYSGGP
jgi:hypothetical protein